MLAMTRLFLQQHWRLPAPLGSGSSGHSNASGWTCENFPQFLQRYVTHVRLLLFDNHHSHVNLDVFNYAKDNYITLVSFAPHCSHELQPLDKSVYGLFKTFVHQASDSSMKDPHNAGRNRRLHGLNGVASEIGPPTGDEARNNMGCLWLRQLDHASQSRSLSAEGTGRQLPGLPTPSPPGWRMRRPTILTLWPVRSLLSVTASRRLRWLKLRQPRVGLTECSLAC